VHTKSYSGEQMMSASSRYLLSLPIYGQGSSDRRIAGSHQRSWQHRQLTVAFFSQREATARS
jgi:hypothetical protein